MFGRVKLINMCGIFGRFSYRNDVISPELLINATQMLSHRGPDGGAYWHNGKYFLGHRRLSIIDLSSGAQPMSSIDGRYVITFNGEIYNYLELKQTLLNKGHIFKTKSDTEVILSAYSEWGNECAKYLEGIFAFAIVDRKDHTLYLARDRFGEKPIFVHETSNDVTFASELIALTSLPGITKSLNFNALAEYLCLNYVPGRQTLINEIKHLPPGCWKIYTIKNNFGAQYWSLQGFKSNINTPLSNNIDTLKHKIDASVAVTLRSDVPVTLFLSGGVDSSLVAESAARQGKIEHAYCLDLQTMNYSEYNNAKQVADRIGIKLCRVQLEETMMQDFFTSLEHSNDPLGDSSALAVWVLAREVAKDYKVAISGDGCDELFGGYLTYRATYFHTMLSACLPQFTRYFLSKFSHIFNVSDSKVAFSYKLMRYLRAIHLQSNLAHFTWNGAWMPQQVFNIVPVLKAKYLNDNDILMSLCNRHKMPAIPTIQDCQLIDCAEYLVNDILVKVDRMTMTHGLEVRAPFLNHDIAEFAVNLPQNQKMNPFGKSKLILRELANQKFGPKIAYAKKQGFSIPIHTWLRGGGRDIMEALLSDINFREMPFLNPKPILLAKHQHLSGKQQLGFELWGLMVFVVWYKTHMLNTPLISTKGFLPKVSFS